MTDHLSEKKKTLLWTATAAVALLTVLMGQCEPLRRIKGTHFLFIWPLTAAAVVFIAVLTLKRFTLVS